jgi:hypothetical protein
MLCARYRQRGCPPSMRQRAEANDRKSRQLKWSLVLPLSAAAEEPARG